MADYKRPVCCKQAEARDQEKCLKKLNEEAEQEWFQFEPKRKNS